MLAAIMLLGNMAFMFGVNIVHMAFAYMLYKGGV
jgi:hypothetical protein